MPAFKTDADISGRTEIKERELHKWNPETHDGEHFETLEGDSEMTSNGEAWDQFAANEKLFGLKTDFDEEIYTTRLDRNAPDFKDREKWAIEKANEIQRVCVAYIGIHRCIVLIDFVFSSRLQQMCTFWRNVVWRSTIVKWMKRIDTAPSFATTTTTTQTSTCLQHSVNRHHLPRRKAKECDLETLCRI